MLLASRLTLCMSALAALLPGSARADVCISDWSVAAAIVREKGLEPLENVTRAARGRLKGEIVKSVLCEEGGRYVYRLVVRTPKGGFEPLALEAKPVSGR